MGANAPNPPGATPPIAISPFRLVAPLLFGAGLDVGAFDFAIAQGATPGSAHLASFLPAALVASWWLVRDDLAARARCDANGPGRRTPWLALGCIVLLVAFLRGGLLETMLRSAALPLIAAHAVTALASLAVLAAAILYLVQPVRHRSIAPDAMRDRFVLAAVLYSVLLRLVYVGQVELLFEEAYYWNYAQHPDFGYLDHPPMVAWVIEAFITLFGSNEFGVRAGALFFWMVTAFFSWKLASEAFDRAIALRVLLLLATLPIYFSIGWFISPDAPLTAFWAMALYFIRRIVANDDRRAWLGLGLALGLGAMSKYTVFLLAGAFGLYVLADRQTRSHLRSREPYLGIALALLLFAPVIVWNVQNEFASFAFQSQARLASKATFSAPRFLLNVLVTLTPTGAVCVVALLLAREGPPARGEGRAARRTARLLLWLCLFPVAVFGALSLIRASKLNWTGPTWLAVLPLIAAVIAVAPDRATHRVLHGCHRAWPPTVAICLLIYAAFMHYLTLGLPGAGYPHNQHLIGWREFAPQIDELKQRIERERGEKILVVGMDRNRIASGLAFYRAGAGTAGPDDPARDSASEHLFGQTGLMYARWFPVAQQEGRTMLLIGATREVLETDRVRSRATALGRIGQIDVRKNGRHAGRYFHRLVIGYRAQPADADAAGGGSDD